MTVNASGGTPFNGGTITTPLTINLPGSGPITGLDVFEASLGSGNNLGQVFGISETPHNSVFNLWWNTANPYGSFETYANGDPIQLGGSQLWLNGGPVFVGNSNANGGATLPAATGLFNVGTTNQFYVTSAGNVSAPLYTGPATAPSGSCSVVGWVFSQDGHATFCNGSTWVTKI